MEERDLFCKRLEALGVQTKPYYALVLHRMEWGTIALPQPELLVTDARTERVVALPMSSEMTAADADAMLWQVLHTLEVEADGLRGGYGSTGCPAHDRSHDR